MFSESKFILHQNKRVLTPFGYQRIESVHKTEPLKTIKITHERGEVLVALHHTFIVDGEEVRAEDLAVGDFLETPSGLSKITKVELSGIKELYDITLDQSEFDNFWYYTNGVLSHNSGKSVTVACYAAWLFNFFKDKNIGIVANRHAQAIEFLKNIKDIYSRIPIWMMQGVVEWNKTSIANEMEMRVLTDVPSGDSFRGYSVNCLIIDECAFIRTQNWEEFADSVFPSQSALAWKKNIIISTAKGLNHFHDIVQKAKVQQMDPNSKTRLVEVKWDEVPRFDSKGNKLEPEEFKRGVIERHGRVYFEQNYGNNFMGSSETLVDPDVLKELMSEEPVEVRDNMLHVFEAPKKDHVYVMGVDAAKEGKDYFAVQILDVTDLPFRQVASANLQVNYLFMADYLYEWGAWYNTCYTVIENNEGAGQSVADNLMQTLEYPNLHFDSVKTKIPGFRTSKNSRDQILKLLKVLIDSKKLNILDETTIRELTRFELVNGKYQASTGHDDAVMALAMTLVPFIKSDNFSDYRKFLSLLKSDEMLDTKDFFELDYLCFDDF